MKSSSRIVYYSQLEFHILVFARRKSHVSNRGEVFLSTRSLFKCILKFFGMNWKFSQVVFENPALPGIKSLSKVKTETDFLSAPKRFDNYGKNLGVNEVPLFQFLVSMLSCKLAMRGRYWFIYFRGLSLKVLLVIENQHILCLLI